MVPLPEESKSLFKGSRKTLYPLASDFAVKQDCCTVAQIYSTPVLDSVLLSRAPSEPLFATEATEPHFRAGNATSCGDILVSEKWAQLVIVLILQVQWRPPAGTRGRPWTAAAAERAKSPATLWPSRVIQATTCKASPGSPAFRWTTDSTGSPALLHVSVRFIQFAAMPPEACKIRAASHFTLVSSDEMSKITSRND